MPLLLIFCVVVLEDDLSRKCVRFEDGSNCQDCVAQTSYLSNPELHSFAVMSPCGLSLTSFLPRGVATAIVGGESLRRRCFAVSADELQHDSHKEVSSRCYVLV